jgi:hypothetical protein
MACFRFVTLPPLPPLPDRRLPRFARRTALATVLPAALLYLRRAALFFAGISLLLFQSPRLVELRKVSDETPQKKVAENRKKHRPTAGDRSLGRRELCLQPIGTLSQNTPFFFCFFCFLTGPYYIDCGLSVRRNYGMARIDPASSRGLT